MIPYLLIIVNMSITKNQLIEQGEYDRKEEEGLERQMFEIRNTFQMMGDQMQTLFNLAKQ